MESVQKHSLHTIMFRSLKRTKDMFLSHYEGSMLNQIPLKDDDNDPAVKLMRAVKEIDQYKPVLSMPIEKPGRPNTQKKQSNETADENDSQIIPYEKAKESKLTDPNQTYVQIGNEKVLVPKRATVMPKPTWHPPWKLYRVISGHNGWVRCLAFDPANEFFVTGASDRMIKIWDLATGVLKLSLTGHVSTVRGLAVSGRHPYMFSCGEDKMVRCWDLEQNKTVRQYHGHMSAVYGMDLHPTLDILVTCGRDSTARIWDIRTKVNVHTLTGHSNTVACVKAREVDPQIISGSHDSTIRLWDLVAGKTMTVLTNHKKSVRAMALHPNLNAFASGSPDNLKQWILPEGAFIQNMSGHNAIINALAMNEDNVVVSGADNGSLYFWDWRSAYNFQRIQSQVQPGSIDSEAGIFALGFDRSGSRLISCEADKTIKIYREDDTATEETHPLLWRPNIMKKAKY